jgi:hypothetical protein
MLRRNLIPNPIWGVVSGYYAYDPRSQAPPAGLFSDRVEPSMRFFLDATLKVCDNSYPRACPRRVTGYEIERVEYFGKTS